MAETAEWRSSISGEDRKKVIEKIAGVLRDITTDDPSRLIALSQKFEEQVYKQAQSAQDYFHLIASRMVNLKQRTKNKVASSPTPTQPQQQQQPNMVQGMNTIPVTSDIGKLQHSLQQSQPMSMNVSNAGNNPTNLTQHALLNKQIGMLNMLGKAGIPSGQNIMGASGNLSSSVSSMAASIMQPNVPSLTIPSTQPNPSAHNVSSMNIGNVQTSKPPMNSMMEVSSTSPEKRYWDKHRSLQQYIRPLNTMIDQIDRLLKDYTGMQEKNLQAIKKKLEYMFELLQETPQTRKNNCSFEEGYKILEAAERQIQHWLQQLSVNKGTPPTPGVPAVKAPPAAGITPAAPTSNPIGIGSTLPTNPSPAPVKGPIQVSNGISATMPSRVSMSTAQPNIGAFGHPPTGLVTSQPSAPPTINFASNNSLMGPPSRESHQVINLTGSSSSVGTQPSQPSHAPVKEPVITIPHEPEKEPVIVSPQNDNEPTKEPKEETKNAFQLLLSKLSHTNQDSKDISTVVERVQRGTHVNLTPTDAKRPFNMLYGQENPAEQFFWWSNKDQTSTATTPLPKQQALPTEVSLCKDDSLKRRKLANHVYISPSKLMSEIKDEIRRFTYADSFFTKSTDPSLEANTITLVRNSNPANLKMYICLEPSERSTRFDPAAILPKITYSYENQKQDMFPFELELAVQKRIKEHGYMNFLHMYKVYLERRRILAVEHDQLLRNKFTLTTNDHITFLCNSNVFVVVTDSYLDFAIPVPPMKVTLPLNYPEASPHFSVDADFDILLPGTKSRFEQRIRSLQSPFSLTSLLESWHSIVSDLLITK